MPKRLKCCVQKCWFFWNCFKLTCFILWSIFLVPSVHKWWWLLLVKIRGIQRSYIDNFGTYFPRLFQTQEVKLYFWVQGHKQPSMCLTLEQNGILKKGTSRRNLSMPSGGCLFFLPCLPFPPLSQENHKVKEVYGPSSSITHPHAMTCTEWDLWNFPHKTTAFNYSVSNYIIDRENLQRNHQVAQSQLPEIHFQRRCWKSLALSLSKEFRLFVPSGY